jgi:hypothetical protein
MPRVPRPLDWRFHHGYRGRYATMVCPARDGAIGKIAQLSARLRAARHEQY